MMSVGCDVSPNCEAENSRIGASSGGQATSNPADGTLPHPPPAHPHPTHVCISVLVSALQAGAAQPEEEEEGSQDGWETASEASEAGEVEMEEQAAAGDEEESDHKFLPGTEQVSDTLPEPPVERGDPCLRRLNLLSKGVIPPAVCPSCELTARLSSKTSVCSPVVCASLYQFTSIHTAPRADVQVMFCGGALTVGHMVVTLLLNPTLIACWIPMGGHTLKRRC